MLAAKSERGSMLRRGADGQPAHIRKALTCGDTAKKLDGWGYQTR